MTDTQKQVRHTMGELHHMPLVRTRREILAARKAAILDAIAGKALTIHDIAASLEIPPVSTWRCVEQLHSADLVHIAGWERTTGAQPAQYTAGPGRDARKPPPLSVARRSARKVKKRAQDPERQLEYDAKQRARYLAQHVGKVRRDPLQVALFGPAAVEAANDQSAGAGAFAAMLRQA